MEDVGNKSSGKPLDNVNIEEAKKKTSDLKVFGNGDTWKLLCKASSKEEGWMKSTKVLEVYGVGCLIQVTTEFRDKVDGKVISCAEAITFAPGLELVAKNGIRELIAFRRP